MIPRPSSMKLKKPIPDATLAIDPPPYVPLQKNVYSSSSTLPTTWFRRCGVGSRMAVEYIQWVKHSWYTKGPTPSPNATEIGGDSEVQQLRASSVLKIIHQFTRATVMDPQAIIVDPFMGAGGTAIAARMDGCYFLGVDRVRVHRWSAWSRAKDRGRGGHIRTRRRTADWPHQEGRGHDGVTRRWRYANNVDQDRMYYIRFTPETKECQNRRWSGRSQGTQDTHVKKTKVYRMQQLNMNKLTGEQEGQTHRSRRDTGNTR